MKLREALDLLQSVSVVFAALMAAYGLDAWRREYVGKRKMELAEEVLALCLETREIISYIRSPGGFQGEGETRKADLNETESVRLARNLAFVPIERHNKHLDKLNRLWALSYRYRAQFGEDAAKPIEDLRLAITKINSSCYLLAMFWPARENSPDAAAAERLARLCAEHEAVIWENHGTEGKSPDDFTRSIDTAVAKITQNCRGVLESRHTLYAWINTKITRH